MPKYITGKKGGVYYVKNGRKVYVTEEKLSSKLNSSKKRSSKKRSSKKRSSKKRSSKKRSAKGCSNQGKYKNIPKNLFCGPAGGACEGTFPVSTRRQAVSALSYSRNAPNPEGIRKCVYKIAKQKGWLDLETKKMRLSSKKKSKRKNPSSKNRKSKK